MQNLFAHTDLGHDYPAVLSITKDDDGRHRVTVRSAGNGGRDQGVIHVSPETLEHMATDVLAAINGEAPPSPATNFNEAIDAHYKAMVDRFLCWKLPADFMPDAGISFDLQYGHESPYWPVGTNLLTADQAKQMFMHCVDLPASTAPAEIIRFTNGEDGVFAHVVAPNGNHFGVSIDFLAEGTGLQSKFFAAVADLVRAGALPTGPVLHTPSGAVFDEVIAAAEPADLVALTPQEHQCCGKCEKSAADQVADDFAATMEKSSRPGDEPTHYSGLGDVECCETVPPLSREPQEADTDWRERYLRDVEGLNNEGDPIGGEPAMGLRQVAEHQRAVIQDLAYRLQTADYVILALLIKAGGEVVVTSEDCGKVPGNVVTNEVSEDKSTFTFRAVAAPQPVAQ